MRIATNNNNNKQKYMDVYMKSKSQQIARLDGSLKFLKTLKKKIKLHTIMCLSIQLSIKYVEERRTMRMNILLFHASTLLCVLTAIAIFRVSFLFCFVET